MGDEDHVAALEIPVDDALRMRRGEYSFDAYRIVLADPRFQAMIAAAEARLGGSVTLR